MEMHSQYYPIWRMRISTNNYLITLHTCLINSGICARMSIAGKLALQLQRKQTLQVLLFKALEKPYPEILLRIPYMLFTLLRGHVGGCK